MAGDPTGDDSAGHPFRHRPDPAGAGRARALLRAWHAIETLTPRTYRREADLAAGGEIVRLSDRRLPWPARRPPRKHHVAYYQVFLGAIEMGPATRRLLEAMDGPAHRPDADGIAVRDGSRAAIASALLDADGAPVDGGVAVSSFAWSLPAFLSGNLGRIGRWAEAEARLVERVAGLLRRPFLDGRLAPLSMGDLRGAHDWLVSTLGLPADLVVPPAFASRILVHERARSDPGPAILNSYFLGDIDRAMASCERDRLPAAARAYLGLDAPEAPVDVLEDRAALARLLAPAAFPPARWPPPNGAPLVTLQQAAANAAGLLADGAGILAVNGPPGTGKTTLLREVVASCLLRRAEAMCAFERPEAAFAAAEGTFEARGRRIHPHRLDPALRGHEVLVASSNNRAVENISRELPAMRALGPGAGDLRHFRALSDALARAAADPHGKGLPLAAEDRTWGLAAAVLGRSSNRRDFVETFWWDPDHGIRTWLALALGEGVSIKVTDGDGKTVGKRPPAMLAAEDPPRGPGQARERWLAARAEFLACRARVASALAAATRAARSGAAPVATLAEAEALCAELAAAGQAAAEAVRAATAALAQAEADEGAARRLAGLAPGSADTAAAASAGHRILADRALALAGATAGRRAVLREAEDARAGLADRWRDATALARRLRTPPDPSEVPGTPVDDAYFAAGHEAWNRAAPWLDAPAHAARDALFAAAMRVHETFALAAAGPVRANLAGFVAAAGGPAPGLEAHLGDFWSTLFLVVPVISTTFASVERMLDGLPDEALGWLVIDEAGQAAPQAALGAIMRCRRAVVVGDPLQVEPVVTLPEPVLARLCAEHALDARAVAAPDASVQTFADLASPFRGSFRDGAGRRATGLPLLVHRRCAEPMFGLANAVAYDGQMVSGAPGHAPAGAVAGILGPSRWFDVPPGAGAGRWRPEEGAILLDLLGRLLDGRRPAPDLFVISPYREVAEAARALVRRQRRPFSASGTASESWAGERIGTIHAFQGREAEAVILLLGASGEGFGGTRRWAARTPNILNVAVSRARERLYVIGDHASWRDAGCFRALARALPPGREGPARAA